MRKTKKIVQFLFEKTNSNRVFGQFWSEYWLRHIEPNSIFRLWFILPFNGQSRRLYNFNVISYLFQPTMFIETGTFYGSSTYLAQGIPSIKSVFSIESNNVFFNVATKRHQRLLEESNLRILHGDSRTALPSVLSGADPEKDRIICYLDAHWEGDIPTMDEVKSLMNWGGNWIALVDDFQIPSNFGTGYGFDEYHGIPVGVNLFKECQGLIILLPSENAIRETGAKRGTAYLFGGKDNEEIVSKVTQSLHLKMFKE